MNAFGCSAMVFRKRRLYFHIVLSGLAPLNAHGSSLYEICCVIER
jgi:hypothetical protein